MQLTNDNLYCSHLALLFPCRFNNQLLVSILHLLKRFVICPLWSFPSLFVSYVTDPI